MSEDFQDLTEELVDLKIEGESKNVKLEQDVVVEDEVEILEYGGVGDLHGRKVGTQRGSRGLIEALA